MKIIKHGIPIPKEQPWRFRCVRCGCVFELEDSDEVAMCANEHQSIEWCGVPIRTKYAAKCPECGAGSEKVEYYEVSNSNQCPVCNGTGNIFPTMNSASTCPHCHGAGILGAEVMLYGKSN